MKVLVASFVKCGTKTLHECLEILGYTVGDFDTSYGKLGDEWERILTYGSTTEMFKKMYEDIDAACDLPPCYYWEEIHKAFPDSKIILTMRSSEEEWLESRNRFVKKAEGNYSMLALTLLSPTGWKLRRRGKLMSRIVFGTPPQFGYLTQPNHEILKRRYREHNESVLRKAPKDKLLVFNLSEGWEPLCKFLGKDIPNCPFPQKNVRGVMLKSVNEIPLFAKIRNEATVSLSIIMIIICVVIYYFFFV